MSLNPSPPAGNALRVILLVAAVGFALLLTVALVVLAFTFLSPSPLLVAPPAVPPPAPPVAAAPVGLGLTIALSLLLFPLLLLGLLLLVFFFLLFACCCSTCRENWLLRMLARLLAKLLPGLGSSLRLAASGFEHAAGLAQEAVDPLHTVGNKLADVGASLASIKIPRVDAETTLFWSALRDALRHAPAPIILPETPPSGLSDLKVLSRLSIDPNWSPMGGEQGVGWWVTFAGNETYVAGDRAQELEKDFKKAAKGLNDIANTLDTIQS